MGPPGPKAEAHVVEADETYVEATLTTSVFKHSTEHSIPVTVCFKVLMQEAVQEQAELGSAVEWGIASQVDKTG